jgi:hypothetical protein
VNKRRTPYWVALGVVLLFACRSGFGGVTVIYDEQFERVCDGTPCGWSQSRGESGQARLGQVNELGDHGLILRGAGVSVAGPMSSGSPVLATVPLGGIRLVVEARCDNGNGLGFSVAVRDATTGSLTEYSTRLSARRPEIAREAVLITSGSQGPDGGPLDQIGGPERFLEVQGISIEKTGDGVCEIGSLQLQDAGDTPSAPEGC